uniref:WD repeat domain 93 n=1 Tax=Sinocyclocheilus anshuiensis TaxID=1608454 RepID=A0A671L2S9_9TELE
MAENVRRGLEIPEPSDYSSCEDDDVTYFTDLQQPDDNLPEYARVVNKLLNNLVDSVWEVISEQEKIKRDEEAARQIPVLNASKDMKLPGRTNSIVCSDDGLYLFLGHTHGLSVISTSTLTCVRTWQDERVELTSISCTSLGNATHLLCTVDDMGIARLFLHHMENVYLIKVINETEDINQRNICAKFEVSRSGDFGAAVMTIWLDVYRFPQDVWLKELETKQVTVIVTLESYLENVSVTYAKSRRTKVGLIKEYWKSYFTRFRRYTVYTVYIQIYSHPKKYFDNLSTLTH